MHEAIRMPNISLLSDKFNNTYLNQKLIFYHEGKQNSLYTARGIENLSLFVPPFFHWSMQIRTGGTRQDMIYITYQIDGFRNPLRVIPARFFKQMECRCCPFLSAKKSSIHEYFDVFAPTKKILFSNSIISWSPLRYFCSPSISSIVHLSILTVGGDHLDGQLYFLILEWKTWI